MITIIGTTKKGYGSILAERVRHCLTNASIPGNTSTEQLNGGTWVTVDWKGDNTTFAWSIAPLIVEDLRSFLLMERMVKRAQVLSAESQVLAWLEACQDSRPRQDRWKRMAAAEILSHLDQTNLILPDGVVRFRMTEWQKQLDTVVDDALALVQRKREMQPWAKLLREWMEKQPTLLDEVRITRRDGKWALTGDRTIAGLEQLDQQFFQRGVGAEERLVGMLLGLAPRRILWCESREDLHRLPLLHMVFGDRVQYAN